MTPGPAAREGIAHRRTLGGPGFAAISDPAYEDIVQLARHVCGSSIAILALAEPDGPADGLTVRACTGLDAHHIPDLHAFCAYALGARLPFEIADLRREAGFARHRLVVNEPGLRFCAGVALARDRNGRPGSLCVLDRHPRRLDAFQREGLAALARTAAALAGPHGSIDDAHAPVPRSGGAESARARPIPARPHPSMQRSDGRYAVAILELDGDSVPLPTRERAMRQIQDVIVAALGQEDVISRDGPGEVLVVFAHAAHAAPALERIGAACAALPDRPRVAIGAAAGRHHRDAMEDVFLEAETALQRARARGGRCIVFAPAPAMDA